MSHAKIGKRQRTYILTTTFAAAIIVLSSIPVTAQDQKGLMDEKALTILKGMSDYIGKSQTISFNVKTFYDIVDKSGIKIKVGRASRVSIKRPKHLYIQSDKDDGGATTIWFNGSKFTIWLRDANKVMSLDYSGTTDAMLDLLVKKYDAQIPLGDLFYSNLAKSFGENLISAKYIGIRVVGGVKCHHLSFESQGADWQIWIEADATPVPRRYVIDFVTEENKPQYMAQMTAWNVGGELEDFNFVAAVPKEVKKVEFKLKP